MNAEANKTLQPADAKKFTYVVFGGILGNNPPRGRTKELRIRMPTAEARNLGRKQMSTDTAVLVTHTILNGKSLQSIQFTHCVEMGIRLGAERDTPYKYVLKDGKPVLAQGLVEMLRRQKGF